ncbi:hypothetical protein [Salibacterium sp. K-3]
MAMPEETTQLLHALLEGQKEITAGVKSLVDRMTRMENRFDKLDVKVDKLEVKVDKLDKGQDEIKERLSKVESGVDLLAMKGWHHEQDIYEMKKKLEHSRTSD